MKLEAYFVIAFVVVYGLIDVHYELPEFPLTIAVIPILFIQMGMSIYFIKHENKLGALAAIVSPSRYLSTHHFKANAQAQVLRMAEIAYLISRILILNGIPQSQRSNTILKDEMLFFAGCALTLAIVACAHATVCLLNFDQGLKPLLLNSGWKRNQYEFSPIHAQARLTSRLELD